MKIQIAVLSGLLAFSTFMASSASAAGYCLALRGNGELAPAHWGALAQVVELGGLPEAMSGGSSASISLFLLESIAQNPVVASGTPIEQRASASLLLKSLQAYLEMVVTRPEWKEMAQLATFMKSDGGQPMEFAAWLKLMVETKPDALMALIVQHQAKIMKSLEFARDIGLVDFQTLMPLYGAVGAYQQTADPAAQAEALKKIQFLAGEIFSSVTLLGKFNAETDQNIFFRRGIVSFRDLALSFGRLASFYAGRSMDGKAVSQLRDFVKMCAPLVKGMTWDELRKTDARCDSTFKKLASDYHEAGLPKFSDNRARDRVGAFIPTFPTTAVLHGSAYASAKKAMKEYPLAMNPAFGKTFSVNSDDVAFGYWGPRDRMSNIEKNLRTPFKDGTGRTWDFSRDAKSARFYDLGDESWEQVLSASPAEPGLASLQEIKTPKGWVYSAGGWSDLHPGAVLKASGCENIVYVTRRGGESLFGQGIAKRLLGFDDIPWDVLATDLARKPANKIRNNNGDPTDMTSQWSRLYNLANPESSFSRALEIFDAVVCTDWDRFDVTQPGAVGAMIAEAYYAPWVEQKNATTSDYKVDPKLGFPRYAGCLPQK